MTRFAPYICALAILAACSRAPNPKQSPTQEYPVTGIVVRVVAPDKLRVAHHAIPGFMEAMTMEFDIAKPSEIAALQPGDVIAGTLRVTETETKLADILKIGDGQPPAEPVQPGIPQPGTEIPDAALIDDQATPFQISAYRGKVLAVTFIYTRCPLPDYCPRMNGNFAASMRELADPRAAWLSITIDPANDTPQTLAQIAQQFTERGDRWRFATGTPAEVERLAQFAGLKIQAAGAQIDHNLRTLIIAPDGKIVKVFTGNQWKPSELTDAIKRALPEK